MLLLICSVFFVVPLVCHVWLRDALNGSAAAGLLIGLVSGGIALWKESVLLGFLVFLFAACIGFTVAYVVGVVLRLFGLAAATSSEVGTQGPGIATILLVVGFKGAGTRRALVGGFGALGLWVTTTVVAAMHRLQTGEWPAIPVNEWFGVGIPSALVGWTLLLVIGLATVVSACLRARKGSRSAL